MVTDLGVLVAGTRAVTAGQGSLAACGALLALPGTAPGDGVSVRINAYYPDGSSPHNIDIEWDEGNPAAEEIVAVVRALNPDRIEVRTGGTDFGQHVPLPIVDPCSRTQCGHGHSAHTATDDMGRPVDGDEHGGACSVCGSWILCRSYVGRSRARKDPS